MNFLWSSFSRFSRKIERENGKERKNEEKGSAKI